MLYLGPPGKLDGRYFYTIAEGRSYLLNLNLEQRANYLFGELIDLWFLVNYSWLFYVLIRKKYVFIPGLFDLVETLLILGYLISGDYFLMLDFLPFFSVPKWFLVAGITVQITVQLFKKYLKKLFAA